MQLGDEIKSGSPSKETRYFLSLPTWESHTKHPTDEVSGYVQKVHPLIAQKISEFVSESMTEVNEVKRALRQYIHSFNNSTMSATTIRSCHKREYAPTASNVKLVHDHQTTTISFPTEVGSLLP